MEGGSCNAPYMDLSRLVSGFNARSGLISDFTEAYAHSVIANLWASNGKSAEEFVTGFYRELEATGGIEVL